MTLTDSFLDVKRRYDESKVANESLRRNEATLLETLHQAEEGRTNAEACFEALRVHAEEKLALASAEVQKAVDDWRQAESSRQALATALDEQTKLVAFWQARARLAEAKLPTVTQALVLKEQENQELVAICDQLMASLQPPASDGDRVVNE